MWVLSFVRKGNRQPFFLENKSYNFRGVLGMFFDLVTWDEALESCSLED